MKTRSFVIYVSVFFVLFPLCVSANGLPEPELDPFIRFDSMSGASLYPDELTPQLLEFSADELPKALIVHADPKPDTLTAAARDYMAGVLSDNGWETELINLYEDHFDPVATSDEIAYQVSPETTDPQVARYQELIRMADALILVYPLWWRQPPAILRGWQDRVFTYGFAYEFVGESPDSTVSLLAGKKVLLINVVAGSESSYKEYLPYLDLTDSSVYSISGLDMVGRHIIYSSTDLTPEQKRDCISELDSLLPLIRPY